MMLKQKKQTKYEDSSVPYFVAHIHDLANLKQTIESTVGTKVSLLNNAVESIKEKLIQIKQKCDAQTAKIRDLNKEL